MPYIAPTIAPGQQPGVPRAPRAFRPPEMPAVETAVPFQGGMVNSLGVSTQPSGTMNYQPRQGADGRPRSMGPGGNTYESGTQARYDLNTLRPQVEARGRRADRLQEEGDAALNDPVGAANIFRNLYADQMAGFANPFLRQVQEQARAAGANAGFRFGGNASEEEGRLQGRVWETGQRELAEAAARMSGQAVDAGMGWVDRKTQAGQDARSEQDRQQSQATELISLIKRKKPKKSVFGTLAGVGLGLAEKAVL